MLHRHAIADTRVLFRDHTVGLGVFRFYGCQLAIYSHNPSLRLKPH
jgi:hypothetical protein